MIRTRPPGSGAPVPLYAVADGDGWGDVQELRARVDVELVASPRHAQVLLVVGAIPSANRSALEQIHDQLPHPRGVVVSGDVPESLLGRAETSTRDADELASTAATVAARLWSHPESSSPDLLADREPNEWRGVGPFGQGGEGMMGGVPYGRPMAMTGDDRDGLALDQLQLRIGPYVDTLPPGLVVDVVLQGEIVQEAELSMPGGAHYRGSAREPRPLLHWLTHALHVHGLDAHAARAARLAHLVSTSARGEGSSDADGRTSEFTRLRRSLRGSGLRTSLRDVGSIDGIDAWDRWDARLDRLEHALGEQPADTGASLGAEVTLDDVATAIEGSTWTDAVTTIVSCGFTPGVRAAS